MLGESEVSSRFHLYILRFAFEAWNGKRVYSIHDYPSEIITGIIYNFISSSQMIGHEKKKKRKYSRKPGKTETDRKIGGDNDRSDQWVTFDEHDKKRSKAGKP